MRDPLSKRLRYEVMRRDGHTCRYCGAKAPDVELTVDHVVPVALGGKNEPTNLVTACRECNAGKSSTVADSAIVEGVNDDAIRWGKAMQRAAEVRATARSHQEDVLDRVDHEWNQWKDHHGDEIPRPINWKESVRYWLRAGLDDDTIVDFVDVAMRRQVSAYDTWRYYCGCCWREIESRQEIARGLIEEEAAPVVPPPPEPTRVPPPPELLEQLRRGLPKEPS